MDQFRSNHGKREASPKAQQRERWEAAAGPHQAVQRANQPLHPNPATLHSAKLTATCSRAPVIHATVTARRKSNGQQQLSLERINATYWTHEQKVPWLPVLLGDLRVYRNLNMVLRNKSECLQWETILPSSSSCFYQTH